MRKFALSILLSFFVIQGAYAIPPETPESQDSNVHGAKDSPGEELKGGAKQIGGGFKRVGLAMGKGIKKGFLATGNLLDKARLSIQRSFGSNSSSSKSSVVEETDLSDDNNNKSAENLISYPSSTPDE